MAALLILMLEGCNRAPNIDQIGGTKLVFQLDGPIQTTTEVAAEALRKRLDPSGVFGVQVTIDEPALEISFPGKTEKDLFILGLQQALAFGNTLEIRAVALQSDADIAAAVANADQAEQNSVDLLVGDQTVGFWRPVAVDSTGKPRCAVQASFSRLRDGKTELLLATSENDILNSHVKFANKVFDEREQPSIGFKLTSEGACRMKLLSNANTGRQVGIIIGGQIIAAPKIMSVMSDRGQITGNFTDAEAAMLVSVLRLGSLPFRVVDEPPQVISVPKAGG